MALGSQVAGGPHSPCPQMSTQSTVEVSLGSPAKRQVFYTRVTTFPRQLACHELGSPQCM